MERNYNELEYLLTEEQAKNSQLTDVRFSLTRN